ncbi:MAG: OmpA family protein [Methylotenera sp.]|nr:OmpA family protein [Methylotenera sp.]
MSRLLTALLLNAALITPAIYVSSAFAQAGDFCQSEADCKPCENKDGEKDQSCASVHGKRIDNGDSLGVRHAPARDHERELTTETFIMSDADTVSAPLAHAEQQFETVEKTLRTPAAEQAVNPLFVSGDGQLTAQLKQNLDALVLKLKGKENLKISVIGHTDNQKLSARAKKIYQDNDGLGLARAKNTADYLAQGLNLDLNNVQIASMADRAPIASNDSPQGMAQNRRIEIKVSYDEVSKTKAQVALPLVPAEVAKPALLNSCEAVLATRTRASTQPFRISVDGVPLQELTPDTGTVDPDVQRCTDVALEESDIQVRYDAMDEKPSLNLVAFPNAAVRHQKVTFTSYSNYRHWIARGEVRLFSAEVSTQSTPLAVLPIAANGQADWQVVSELDSLQYVLRVYDQDGNFDETIAQPLQIAEKSTPLADKQADVRENLIGYGENRLKLHNIPVRNGGAVTANGINLKAGQTVRFLGEEVPVDKNGKFAVRQILPAGNHVVKVAVLEENGTEAMTFNRNLYIPDQDWFYIALADITGGRNSTSGPAQLVTGDTQHFDNEAYVDGRLAFYLKGKVKGDWLLTASADTKEQPIKHLFSNFDDKDPRYLLRRLDPDRYYPVYGDDSTTVEDAPTRGKFYVKLARGESHVMWGNFQTQLSGSDLVQYSRGMYGANLKVRSDTATSFGQKKSQIDAFVGDPGTLGAREQFRGTGGSLYYVQHQDTTRGSEKVWVEVRDKDSGIVLKTTQLSATQDYDFDAIQGRLLLTSPLPSTADDSQLVRAGSLSGNPVFLVVSYEYTPSIRDIDNMTVGGHVSQWLGDKVQIGATGYRQGDQATRQHIYGIDATYRISAGVYLKAETARSSGAGTATQSSTTGGFEFNSINAQGGNANAHRVEFAADLSELSSTKGKVNVYWQDREKGFSSPGQITNEDSKQVGFATDVEITEATSVQVKTDVKNADTQDTKAIQASVKQKFTQNWAGSVGVRLDNMDTYVANASKTLSQDGDRTDLGVQIDYQPDSEAQNPDWNVYGFVQNTVSNSGNRLDNDRIGAGGKWRVNEKFSLLGEASSGNQGFGGKLGGDWQVTDRSQLYLNYALDADRTDSLYRGRQGTLVTGAKSRYTDSMTVYGEERLLHGVGQTGLMHAFGLDLAAQDGWNFGTKAETGKLADAVSGDLDRTALSFSIGRAIEKTKYAGNIEWRSDDSSTAGKRTTWLVRNSLSYQTTPDWRALGKLNFSVSDSSLGNTFDADFVEGVLGYAYRPVNNDKLNTLFKYTYFANMPSSSTISTAGVSSDYEQRSHILSVDAIYDIKPWLSIGGKYGYRKSEIRAPKATGDWVDADAHLVVGRADWHFVHDWDALLEVRWLNVPAADDSRAGALVGIYRHLNNNVKVGGGYNFTDFSDDMTDMSYRSHGWYVNLISKF